MKSWIEPETEGDNRIASGLVHVTIWTLLLALLAAFALSYFLRVEIVAQGEGRVVPAGRVQIIQPEFDGSVAAIPVSNGQIVQRGDVLIALDDTAIKAQLGILTQQRRRLLVETARIDTALLILADLVPAERDAEVARAAMLYEEKITGESSAFAREQAALLEIEIRRLANELARIEAELDVATLSQKVTETRIEKIDGAIRIQADRLGMQQSLSDRGVGSRTRYLDELDELRQLEKEREVQSNLLAVDARKLALLQSEEAVVRADTHNILLARRAEIIALLEELGQRVLVEQRALQGTKVRAPVDGVVDQLGIYTIGGVVAPGQELMRIVPEDQPVEIEARFQNSDIGRLVPDLAANIKLAAYPSERYGYLSGTVASVSADAVEFTPGELAFTAKIVPGARYLEQNGQLHPIKPGMTAQVDVITGERRLISYFFEPVLRVFQNSLREQ